MNHLTTIARLSLLLLLLIGCSSREPASRSEDRATDISPAAEEADVARPLSEPKPLRNIDLLMLSELQSSCDHSEGASIDCTTTAEGVQMEIEINASNFARWSLRWADRADGTFQPLTGTETLILRIGGAAGLAPNLYLVESDGRRHLASLRSFGLRDDSNRVVIPLAEIQDEEGNRPKFSNVVEMQLVFEWADMAGELSIDDVRFNSIWRERLAISDQSVMQAEGLGLPPGFRAEPLATDLRNITQIDFLPDGSMMASLQAGRIWWYRDVDDDGVYDWRHLYTTGLGEIVGLLYDPVDSSVWLGGRGVLYHTKDSDGDGVADIVETRIDGLPWGRHQNNGLVWNPGPDPFTGEEEGEWIYFGLGSTEDLEVGGPFNAAVLRFPRDGQGQGDLEIVSRGNRNPYMLAWAQIPLSSERSDSSWQLFASENGPDFNDAPDEVNHIRWQHHYGFPEYFGPTSENMPDTISEMPYSGSIYAVTPHASASGLAFIGNPDWPAEYRTLYVSLYGEVFSEEVVGHTVDRIDLTPVDSQSGATFEGESTPFITGLDRPLPMAVDPAGNLIVGDYATGLVYRVKYSEE